MSHATATRNGERVRQHADPGQGTYAETFVRAIYHKHGAFLLRMATGLLGGDRHQAQDLVQEAVLRAWRQSDRFDAQAEDVRPWLATVLRNLTIDAHRARSSRPPETDDDALDDLPGPEYTEDVITTNVVREALADLSYLHREILVHVQYLDQSVAQASKTLGIPPGTVKSRTHLALKAFRVALAERGYTP